MTFNSDNVRNRVFANHSDGCGIVGSFDAIGCIYPPSIGEILVYEGGGNKYAFTVAAVELVETIVIRRIHLKDGVVIE